MLPSSFCVCALSLSRVQRFVTPWAVAHQVPLFMEFSSWEYWSGLPFPTPGDLPDSGIEPPSLASLVLAGGFFTTEPPGKPTHILLQCINFPCSLVRPNLLLLLFHAHLQSSLLSVAFFSSSSSSFPSLPDHTHQYTSILWHHPCKKPARSWWHQTRVMGGGFIKQLFTKARTGLGKAWKLWIMTWFVQWHCSQV